MKKSRFSPARRTRTAGPTKTAALRHRWSSQITRDSWLPVLEETRQPTWSKDYFSL